MQRYRIIIAGDVDNSDSERYDLRSEDLPNLIGEDNVSVYEYMATPETAAMIGFGHCFSNDWCADGTCTCVQRWNDSTNEWEGLSGLVDMSPWTHPDGKR